MNKKPKELTLDGVEEIIKQSGYLTEINVAHTLRTNGWMVFSQSPYIDGIEKSLKLIDVLAIKKVTSNLVVALIIECKKSTKHGWAFYTIPKMGGLQSVLAFVIDFFMKLKGVPISAEALQGGDSSLEGFHLANTETKIGTLCCIPPKHPDDFHEASRQVLGGLMALRERVKKHLLFPIIVFEGPMWEFYYDENGKLEIKESDYLQYLSFVPEDSETSICLIDIVKSSHFTDFLKLIDGSIEWLENVAKIR